MSPTRRVSEILRRVPIFNGLTETEFQFLAERAVPRDYHKGEILFTEGDPCTGLFVIESGHVRIFKNSPNGREQILTIEGPGSSVAELPLFDGGTYPASSAAVADARIYFISKQDLENNILFPRAIAMESEKEVSV
jgi:CRP/FNR family cyclic AMP-dependent transcriptional regulator